MLPVTADATRLPFADRTFDLVLCPGVMTVLEGSLPRACEEIARVARGRALIVSPCGRDAESLDRENARWCREHGIRPPDWFEAQVARGLPDPAGIRDALAPFGRVTEGATISVPWMRRIFRLEQRLRQLRAMTATQPLLRGSPGALLAREAPGGGPPYERWFSLEIQPTVSPPRSAS